MPRKCPRAADPEALGSAARASFSGTPAGTMVFLTPQLWLRSRVTDRYWRVQEVLKHARVSWPRRPCPRAPGSPRTPPVTLLSRFFDPALPGEEEPLLPAGRPGCDQSVCEMHQSPETEEGHPEDGEPGARRPSRLGRRVTAGGGARPPPSPPAGSGPVPPPLRRKPHTVLTPLTANPAGPGGQGPRSAQPAPCVRSSAPVRPPEAPRGFPSHPTR